MPAFEAVLGRRLAGVDLPLALVLPGGQRIGPDDAAVTLTARDLRSVAHLVAGRIGALAQDHVEGRLGLSGAPRDLMRVAAQLLSGDPTALGAAAAGPLAAWRPALQALQGLRSRLAHRPERDARQVQFHYDVSDDFYALWLDPRRVYSCAYYAERGMTLAQAQEAKLEHLCRKLMLREGERFLDVGAGWGALLLWAAERHGVIAHGITLSRHQHAHVQRLIDERGLRGRVSIELCDYRALQPARPFDKIASVGMFEHVGRAQLPDYFRALWRLLAPGGLLMNHGITAGGTRNAQLGAGMGDFIERYIFPGGELHHVSHVLAVLAEQGLEALDVENLRPHYARTLWAWSDALESRLDEARRLTGEAVVRAYRLYLAGSAMAFEHGWISLHQVLCSRPSGDPGDGPLRGAQSAYPFTRRHVYR